MSSGLRLNWPCVSGRPHLLFESVDEAPRGVLQEVVLVQHDALGPGADQTETGPRAQQQVTQSLATRRNTES